MDINNIITIQGRCLKSSDIEVIKSLIKDNPSWHRTKLSKEICELWDWKRPSGGLKDMACRTMLLKLEDRKLLKLPEHRKANSKHSRKKKIGPVQHSKSPIATSIDELYPILISGQAGNRAVKAKLNEKIEYIMIMLNGGKTISRNTNLKSVTIQNTLVLLTEFKSDREGVLTKCDHLIDRYLVKDECKDLLSLANREYPIG